MEGITPGRYFHSENKLNTRVFQLLMRKNYSVEKTTVHSEASLMRMSHESLSKDH